MIQSPAPRSPLRSVPPKEPPLSPRTRRILIAIQRGLKLILAAIEGELGNHEQK